MLATITYTDKHLYRRSRPFCVIYGVGKKVWLSGEHEGKGTGTGTEYTVKIQTLRPTACRS
jgi:hypothetical protein